jgi:23S rRNA pseudouridine2605 synthase
MADPDNQTGERIAKVIARSGVTSRREAEEWIAAGRVTINGEVIRSPARNVTSADHITVDGNPLPARERTRLFFYHKPRGLVTTHADPQGRPTIFQRLPKHLPRLISVGRLDLNTEGLLLLTNDGGLARALELPATGWLRRYRVRAHGTITQDALDRLRSGVTVNGIRYGAIDATLDRVQGSNLWLTFAIREGKNREVRNVLGELGLMVTRLIRVSFGPFQLGDLAEGAVEEVRTRVLREQLGERVIALSGADFSAPMAPPPAPQRREETGETPQREPASRKSPKQKARGDQTSHSWRATAEGRAAKKLSRKFRGSRRQGEKRPPRSEKAARAGLLTDRKGRRVLVEQFGEAQPQTPSKHSSKHSAKHSAKHSPRHRPRPRRGR